MFNCDFEPLNNMLLRIAVDKLYSILGTSAVLEIRKKLMAYEFDLNDCYERPDILCKILKHIYGSSYVRMIESL